MLRRAYGCEAVGRTQYFEWHRRVQSGRSSFEDDERSERPSTSITPKDVGLTKIRQLVHEDRRRSMEDFTNMIGVSFVCPLDQRKQSRH